MIIITNLLRILTTSFRGEDFSNLPYRDKPHPMVAIVFEGSKRFNHFCRGSPSYNFCKIMFNSDHWFTSLRGEDVLSSLYGDVMETGHNHWRPFFDESNLF